MAALGAGRAVSRAAALRCRPPGGGAKRGTVARQSRRRRRSTIAPAPLLSRTGRLSRRLPGPHARTYRAARLHAWTPLALAPHTVRVLAAERAAAMKCEDAAEASPPAKTASSSRRCRREIDGGRTPIKRIVGERVEVWADIFTDGHEKIAADMLYRPADELEWRRAPDGVSSTTIAGRGSFPLERNAPLPVHDRGVARPLWRPGSASSRRSAAPASTCASRPSRAFASPRRRRRGRRRRRRRGGAARAHGAPHGRERRFGGAARASARARQRGAHRP